METSPTHSALQIKNDSVWHAVKPSVRLNHLRAESSVWFVWFVWFVCGSFLINLKILLTGTRHNTECRQNGRLGAKEPVKDLATNKPTNECC